MSKLNEELVRAFNVNNYISRVMRTNFTVQDLDGRDYVTMTFADNMNREQCVGYLNNLRENIIKEFYQSENGAKKSFNLNYFPFKRVDRGALSKDAKDLHNRWQFKVPITPPVLFNLKSHLAHSVAVNVMLVNHVNIDTISEACTNKKYIMYIRFPDRKSANEFAEKFLSQINEYNNPSSDSVKVKDNDVYIRDIFNDINLIKSSIQETTQLIGRGLESANNKSNQTTTFKNTLTQFIYHSTGIKIYNYHHSGYSWVEAYSILIPMIQDSTDSNQNGFRSLNFKEIRAINTAFDFEILNNITECVKRDNLSIGSPELQRKGIHGIDFYNKDISNCVINTVLENSLVTQVGRDKYGLVVGSSPQLLELYIRNIKSENVRRPSTPEIQVRPSTSWQDNAALRERPKSMISSQDISDHYPENKRKSDNSNDQSLCSPFPTTPTEQRSLATSPITTKSTVSAPSHASRVPAPFPQPSSSKNITHVEQEEKRREEQKQNKKGGCAIM